MVIISEDNKKFVDVGKSDILYALFSTADARLGMGRRKVSLGLAFLETGNCEVKDALETARQLNLIRDELSKFSPDKMVYSKKDPKKAAPWGKSISPIITSCSNYFTTADGKDLLSELVGLLVYADLKKKSVSVDD